MRHEPDGPDRWLTRIWVLTLAVFMLLVVVPWFFRATGQRIAPVATGTWIWAIAYALLSTVVARLHGNARVNATAILHLVSIFVLGILWHLAGGGHNPILLLAFEIPIVAGAMVLPRRAASLSVVVATLSVLGVLLAESTDFRSAIYGLGLPIEGLSALVSPTLQDAVDPFPRLVFRPSFLGVMALGFAVLSASLVYAARRLSGWQTRAAVRETTDLRRGREAIFGAMIGASPTPSLVVYADSGRALLTSRSFVKQMLLHNKRLDDGSLFQWLTFDDPASVRTLLMTGGEIKACGYRVGNERRKAWIRVASALHSGRTYAYITMTDRSDAIDLEEAWRQAPEPLIVISQDDRIRFANPAAERIFGEMYAGLSAREALNLQDLTPGWWSSLSSRSGQTIRTGGREFIVERLVGEPATGEPLVLLRLENAPKH